jgi:hypothetical protein
MLMKRVWGHVLAGIGVLGIGSGAVFACVHNDSSIFIQNVLAPQLVSSGQACTYTSATTQPYLPSGTLDVLFRDHYDAVYLVGNQLVAEANSSQLMTETSTVTIQGGIVRLTDSSGNALGTGTFTRLTSGTIYPAAGGVPSYTAIGLTSVIDAATVMALKNNAQTGALIAGGGSVRVVTYVRFFGNTLGGRYIESDEFEFPVDVCSGCLITFSEADVNPCYKTPNCLGNPAAGTSSANTAPCNVGQDQGIDCAQCQAVPQCRGAYPNGPPAPDAGCI